VTVNVDDIRGKATITVAEAAELLGLDQRSVRNGCLSGEIPSVKIGRRTLIPVPKLLAMIDPS
jgi:excisionase family DNA binding protein